MHYKNILLYKKVLQGFLWKNRSQDIPNTLYNVSAIKGIALSEQCVIMPDTEQSRYRDSGDSVLPQKVLKNLYIFTDSLELHPFKTWMTEKFQIIYA